MASSTSFPRRCVILPEAPLFKDFQRLLSHMYKLCINNGAQMSKPITCGKCDKSNRQRWQGSMPTQLTPLPVSFRLEWVWATLVLTLWVWAKQTTSLFLATLSWILPHWRPLSALIWFLFYFGPFHCLMVTDQLTRRALNGQKRNKPLFSFIAGATSSIQS